MFTTVAQLDDVPEGSLFGLESEDGQEIVLANVEGYDLCITKTLRSCGAPLSEGTLNGTTLICPMHFAQFDVVTGEKIQRCC